MAEGLVNHFFKDRITTYSAGNSPAFVHPLAIKAMADIGIDISGQRSKSVDEFAGESFDVVVTLCDNARESCPIIFGQKRKEHIGFDDPAMVEGTEEEKLQAFIAVRNNMQQTLVTFFEDFLKQKE
jgi:arsenate reductase